jgi:PAS domain S-box-containing protein
MDERGSYEQGRGVHTMNWQKMLYLWPYVISVLVSAGIGLYAWRKGRIVGALFFACGAWAEAIASLGYIGELVSPTLAGKIFWDSVQWLGFMGTVTTALLFALAYTGHKSAYAQRTWFALAVVPFLVVVLGVTGPLHGWLHPAPRIIAGDPFSALVYDFNILLGSLTLYSQSVVLWGILILSRHFMRARPFYRHQIAMVIVGYTIPLVGSILSVSRVIPHLPRDITPFTFALGNMVAAWGLFRHHLLMITPVAYETVIESIGDGVLVLDAQARIVDLNPAMAHILRMKAKEALGKPSSEVLQSWPDLAERLQDSVPKQAEVRLTHGKMDIYYDVHMSLLFDHRGAPNGQILVLRDITARKRVEEDIRRAKEAWERTFDAVPDLITILDKHYQIVRVNKAMAERLNRAPEACVGQICYHCLHGTEVPPPFCPHAQVLRDHHPHTAEVHDTFLEGDFVISVSPIFDEQGELYGSVHVARDITARKRIERELQRYRDHLEDVVADRTAELQREIFERRRTEVSLRQSEEFNRSIIESSVDCIKIVDLEGRLRFMNGAGQKLMGITDMAPYVGMPYHQFWEGADRQSALEALEKARQGGQGAFEGYLATPIGAAAPVASAAAGAPATSVAPASWWSVVASPIWGMDGTVERVLVVSRDITTRKQSEQRLRESELRYRTLFENASIGIGLATLDGSVVAGNASILRYFGHTLEELKHANLRRFYKNPQERDRLLAELRANGAVRGFEAELLRKDGTTFFAGISVNFVEVDGKKTLLTMLEDITERRQAEVALRESEQHLRLLMQQAPVGIIAVDMEGTITDANPIVFDLLAASGREAILGLNVLTLPAMVESDLSGYFAGVLETGESRVVEAKYKSGEGGGVYVRARIVPRFDAHGEQIGAIQILEDVTDRKRAQEKLAQQAQELARSHAELRRFAYVASHDLQEPLRAVSIYTQMLARHCEGKLDPDAVEFMTYIVTGVRRIQAMIKGLQIYLQVDRDAKDFAPVDAEAALERALFRLQEGIVQTDAVITHDPLPTVMADRGQLSQVFEYLIDNAIKFRGEDVPRVHITAEETENVWIFSVRDNGIGIAPEYFARIFEIFRRLHHWEDYPGIGIGLTLCKKIVERHGGSMWVESTLGEGATFYFTLVKGEM